LSLVLTQDKCEIIETYNICELLRRTVYLAHLIISTQQMNILWNELVEVKT